MKLAIDIVMSILTLGLPFAVLLIFCYRLRGAVDVVAGLLRGAAWFIGGATLLAMLLHLAAGAIGAWGYDSFSNTLQFVGIFLPLAGLVFYLFIATLLNLSLHLGLLRLSQRPPKERKLLHKRAVRFWLRAFRFLHLPLTWIHGVPLKRLEALVKGEERTT